MSEEKIKLRERKLVGHFIALLVALAFIIIASGVTADKVTDGVLYFLMGLLFVFAFVVGLFGFLPGFLFVLYTHLSMIIAGYLGVKGFASEWGIWLPFAIWAIHLFPAGIFGAALPSRLFQKKKEDK